MTSVQLFIEDAALKKKIGDALDSLGYRVLREGGRMDKSADVVLVKWSGGNQSGINWEQFSGPAVILIVDNFDGLSPERLKAADDFVFATCDNRELDARIKTTLGKLNRLDGFEPFRPEDLTVDSDSYEVCIRGCPLNLTYKEFELLKYLMINRGRVCTRDQLLSRVWGYDYFGGTRTVDVHIRRLRAKLEAHGSLVETVRNVGYRFKK